MKCFNRFVGYALYMSLFDNVNLTSIDYSKALTNYRSFMKLFIILSFLLYAIFSSIAAHADIIDRVAEREERLLVKQHMIEYPKSGYYDHRLYSEKPKRHYASTRPIDGPQESIIISQNEREGYVNMPQKPKGEHYYGR